MAVCECLQGIGYRGRGERGQAGSGGRQMPPIPGAGGNPELRYRALAVWRWRGRAVSQYGSWHSQHQVTRQVITCQLLLTPECEWPLVTSSEWGQWPAGSEQWQHWALSSWLWCLAWALGSEWDSGVPGRELSSSRQLSRVTSSQTLLQSPDAAAGAAARGKPVPELAVAVVEKFARISRFFHPFSASRQFQREGEL